MAEVVFLMQGLQGNEDNHMNALSNLLNMEDSKKIILSTAYLKSAAIQLHLDLLKDKSDQIEMFVGIRNGVTSKQALQLLISLGLKVFVVDTGGIDVIFHPKTHVAYNDDYAMNITGSGNYTPSGMLKNIESSLLVKLDLCNESDKLCLEQIIDGFEFLKTGFPQNCYKLESQEQIDSLFDDGKLMDEQLTTSRSETVGSSDSKKTKLTPRMKLKTQKLEKQDGKQKSNRVKKKPEPEPVEVESVVNEPIEIVGIKGITTLREVWKSKPLTERDLNIPKNKNTHVTGSMSLSKGLYEIDQRHYFREVVFSALDWETKKDWYDQHTSAVFHLKVNGVYYGSKMLALKHDARTDTRSYEQKNSMTHLRWGELKPFVAQPELLGEVLKLYLVDDKVTEFLIEIEPDASLDV